MAAETTWGAPWIHGALLRLGFVVSERSVSRFLTGLPRPRRRGPSRAIFLRTHRDALAAMDLLTDAPPGRAIDPSPGPGAHVVALPRVAVLHRRYAWRRAA